jgi:hypothetical protein
MANIATRSFIDCDTMVPVNDHDIGIGQWSLFPLQYLAPKVPSKNQVVVVERQFLPAVLRYPSLSEKFL